MYDSVFTKKYRDAIVTASQNYVVRFRPTARSPLPNVNKEGMQDDCATALKVIDGLTDEQRKAINALGLSPDLISGIKNATNVKVVKRMTQLLAFAVTTDRKYVQGSVRTFLKQIWALAKAGAKSRDALKYAATGKGSEHTSDNVNVSALAAVKMLGNTRGSSEQTQYSVGFAQGGLATILGAATKASKTAFPEVQPDSVMLGRIVDILSAMSDSTREAMLNNEK